MKNALVDIWMAFWLTIGISWIVNFVQLVVCDFEAPYRCEAIHGIGFVIPPLSVVTVWVDWVD